MDIIRLTSENIQSCDLKTPVAIYFQNNGRKCRICIFKKDKKMYYINIVENGITLQEIKEKCPVLKECDALKTLEGGETPQDWNVIYMGHGKNILLAQDVCNKIISNFGNSDVRYIYKNGKKMLLSVL